MQAVKVGDVIYLYSDNALPEKYKKVAVNVDFMPEKPPECMCHLDIVGGELLWVPETAPAPTVADRIADLEAKNKQLTSKLDAAIQSNQMLEDCLVEMAEIVYV